MPAFLTFHQGWLTITIVTSLAYTVLGLVGLRRAIKRRPCSADWHMVMGLLALWFAIESGLEFQPFWLAVWLIAAFYHSTRTQPAVTR